VTLPDGRERTVRCATGHANDDNGGGDGGDGDGGDDNDNAFVGYGRSKRAAQQAAAEAVRAWFQKEGLWDPNAPKPPLPETGGLVRAFWGSAVAVSVVFRSFFGVAQDNEIVQTGHVC
jgi:hypothetical protein